MQDAVEKSWAKAIKEAYTLGDKQLQYLCEKLNAATDDDASAFAKTLEECRQRNLMHKARRIIDNLIKPWAEKNNLV